MNGKSGAIQMPPPKPKKQSEKDLVNVYLVSVKDDKGKEHMFIIRSKQTLAIATLEPKGNNPPVGTPVIVQGNNFVEALRKSNINYSDVIGGEISTFADISRVEDFGGGNAIADHIPQPDVLVRSWNSEKLNITVTCLGKMPLKVRDTGTVPLPNFQKTFGDKFTVVGLV